MQAVPEWGHGAGFPEGAAPVQGRGGTRGAEQLRSWDVCSPLDLQTLAGPRGGLGCDGADRGG